MEGIFILMIIFSVPLSVIASRTWLKHKQLELEAGRGTSATRS